MQLCSYKYNTLKIVAYKVKILITREVLRGLHKRYSRDCMYYIKMPENVQLTQIYLRAMGNREPEQRTQKT